jgi:hypothetical protein
MKQWTLPEFQAFLDAEYEEHIDFPVEDLFFKLFAYMNSGDTLVLSKEEVDKIGDRFSKKYNQGCDDTKQSADKRLLEEVNRARIRNGCLPVDKLT